MKTCYVIKQYRAIADLVAPGELTEKWTITRINVPVEHRGKGIGSQLLKRILLDADAQGVELVLEVFPSGDLNRSQLEAWYGRYGFVEYQNGYLIRPPTRHYTCHFCGEEVTASKKHEQECRPDLFPHEMGKLCTWPGIRCYWDHEKDELAKNGMIPLQ